MTVDGGAELVRAVVIGGGTMGAGIASVLARAGYDVDLVEAGDTSAHAALARTRALLGEAARRGRLAPDDLARAEGRLSACGSLRRIDGAVDLVIEAVPEREELKRRILGESEALAPTLLATNTSSLAIASLGASLTDRRRFLGLHFFNPVPAMPLVEVVLAPETSDAAREAALRHVSRIGKEAIVIADTPGFATSRLGVALGLEAIRMLEQGVAAAHDIDRAMELGYRHPIGPLRLSDIVGLDVRLDIARHLERAYGDRFAPPQLLVRMVAEGRLGKKSGHGFYPWPAP